MNRFRKIRKSTRIITLIAACVAVLTTCISDNEDGKVIPQYKAEEEAVTSRKTDFREYTGSAKCAGCHKDIYKSHVLTSHYLTTRPALEKNIMGSFSQGKNIFTYNKDLFMAMEKRDSGLFQVVYYKGEEKIALPFDMTIGSGTKGQSFIYWNNNWLFQLPITYFSIAGQWANSPGFPAKVQYKRPITSRCLECHTTFADVITPWPKEPEEFDHKKIIFGVGCEKCHGPGALHVEFHSQNPKVKKAEYIINPANLSRQQNMDLCALCHGGRKEKTQPSFSFRAGDTLSHYFVSDTSNTSVIDKNSIDVHGNQVGLLMASKCFRVSNTMTCNSCHNSHENERGKAALFSQRCMNCHQSEHKPVPGAFDLPVSSLKKNCINCHMPAEPSHSIVLYTSSLQTPKAAMFRSHFISIYPDQTKKFLQEAREGLRPAARNPQAR